jgi:hypothetical protein
VAETQITRAPCSRCLGETEHRILHFVGRQEEDTVGGFSLLECAGCKSIVLREHWRWIHDGTQGVRYYPSPASRRAPKWAFQLTYGIDQNASAIGELLEEVYQAVRGGQYRLAVMGVRALIEQVLIDKVGDQGTFAKNLEAFHAADYISLVQRDALTEILDAGHAVIHRKYKPTEDDLETALDIVEGIIAAVYFHGEAAKNVGERVPPRRPRLK